MPGMASTVLTTSRLELTPLVPEDMEALWPFVSDPSFPEQMLWAAHEDRRETEAFIAFTAGERAEGSGYTYAIRHQGALVGVIGLTSIRRRFLAVEMNRGELGYWCGRPHQGKGFVTEAAARMIAFGFDELGLHKIEIGCVTDNLASKRVIEKLGFRFVGERRDHHFKHGRWWSHLEYEMTVAERSR
jgi:RimJ/RimL family protein N-acetyltransferase